MGLPRASSPNLARPGRQRGFVLTHVLLFVVVSVLTGVLAAGLAIPFVGMLGLGTQSATDYFYSLPSKLPEASPPERSRLLDQDGNLLATFYDQNRVNVKLEQVAPVMQQAVIAIEDSRFYEHGPMDAKGVLRAFVRNQQDGGVSQGGSTITQQYVKQLLAEAADTPEERRRALEESYGRKLQELRYAVEVEKAMTKKQILENYLNIVYFGDGAYGVESAARHFFSVPAKKLTLSQSAMLAGLIRNPPASLDTKEAREAALSRRDLVLDRMAATGVISRAEAQKAAQEPLGLKITDTRNGCVSSFAPFFCQYAETVLLKDEALGATREDRRKLIYEGGLTIRTTLDRDAQRAAQRAVSKAVHPTDEAIGAISLVEPGTGYIRAMAQSRPMGNNVDKGEVFLNYNVGQAENGGLGFQPGSTFKPFVMAAALKQGIGLRDKFPAPSSTTISQSVRICPDGKPGWNGTPWAVSNSTSAGSNIDMVEGTVRSVNTFYAYLEAETGICEPAKIAAAMGAERGDGERLQQYKPFVLGINEVTPLSMAEAYATFAARGRHCDATPILEVRTRTGIKLPIKDGDCRQVLPKDVADAVNYVLRQVIDGPDPGRTGQAMHMDGRQAAGKTGTNNSRETVSFAGYTTNMAAFATVSDDHSPQRSLLGQTIGGEVRGADDVWGGALAGPIWLEAMEGALKGKKSPNFVEPDASKIEGVQLEVPNVVGMSQDEAEKTIEDAGFSVSIGEWVDSDLPRGTIAKQYPTGMVDAGSTIILNPSDGTPYVPEPERPEFPGDPCDRPNPPPTCGIDIPEIPEDPTDPGPDDPEDPGDPGDDEPGGPGPGWPPQRGDDEETG